MAKIYIRTPVNSIANKPKEPVFSTIRRLKHDHRMEFDKPYKERVTEKRREKEKTKFIRRVARRLSRNLPKSEVWFWEEWKKLGMLTEFEGQNKIFSGKIPDVINKRHRYIIEIDGSVHQREDVKAKDRHKEFIYMRRRYKFWRIVDGDIEKLKWVAKQVMGRRFYMEKWIAENPEKNLKLKPLQASTNASG